jgi:amino acid adenylation domain-containing protein
VLVGLCLERSLEMLVGLLGILKAGGAYVPLDPEYPEVRLSFMVHDSNIPLLLTQARLLKGVPTHNAQVIQLDADWPLIAGESTETRKSGGTAQDLAYVIYTSGSTGQPKGAMNTHLAIVNRLLWMQDAYRLQQSDRVLQKTPISFDVSVWEFFWPLMTGARLVLAVPGGHRDSTYLADLIAREKVTTLHFVPSMLDIFLREKEVGSSCASLKRVFCSGEALPVELQDRFFSQLSAELHNLYGPTEAAVDVTYWVCQRSSSLRTIPIGRPIANIQMYILDSRLEPVPVGVSGELHIGGIGLARGYLNRPELTAEKFIPDPFSQAPEARLYKTGDLARYRPDGAIEYLGRLDFQVKLRGFRIELGEIETVLKQHPSVREAVVVAREDAPGDRRLVAYVASVGESVPAGELRENLKARLPAYMIPSAFVFIETFPLTPNGKLDRKALPVPEGPSPEPDGLYVAPRTPTEEALANIWREVLNLKQVGIHDNFFELGGHSLLATQVISRVRDAFELEITLGALFEAQTIDGLAEQIENLLWVGRGSKLGASSLIGETVEGQL